VRRSDSAGLVHRADIQLSGCLASIALPRVLFPRRLPPRVAYIPRTSLSSGFRTRAGALSSLPACLRLSQRGLAFAMPRYGSMINSVFGDRLAHALAGIAGFRSLETHAHAPSSKGKLHPAAFSLSSLLPGRNGTGGEGRRRDSATSMSALKRYSEINRSRG